MMCWECNSTGYIEQDMITEGAIESAHVRMVCQKCEGKGFI